MIYPPDYVLVSVMAFAVALILVGIRIARDLLSGDEHGDPRKPAAEAIEKGRRASHPVMADTPSFRTMGPQERAARFDEAFGRLRGNADRSDHEVA